MTEQGCMICPVSGQVQGVHDLMFGVKKHRTTRDIDLLHFSVQQCLWLDIAALALQHYQPHAVLLLA